MRKCPRCGHEIEENEKYCPHCGLDLQGKYRPIQKKNKAMTYLLYVIIFFSFITIPLFYSRLLDNIGGKTTQINEERIELPAIENQKPQSILATYDTLADFNKQFTNVSHSIEGFEKYEEQLTTKGGYQFDKTYSIQVLDNYDIYYSFKYTAKISDELSMVIEKGFNRGHTFNDEKITFKKVGVKDFNGFIFTSEQMEVVKPFIKDITVVEKLMNDFSLRQEEFDKKKEKLGHYGLGNYDGQSSFVAYRDSKEYYSELTYGQSLSEYID